jgi:hypothetical protein
MKTGATQVQMISDSELSELINVPREWRNGDEKVVWPRTHNKFNIEWLTTLWKYIIENHERDLTMLENLNIIFTDNSNNSSQTKLTNKNKEIITNGDNSKQPNLVLFKLSKNSNLVYTPPYDSSNDKTNSNFLKF